MGLCGSSTTEVAFEDVILPADHLLGPVGEGFKVALSVLNSGRHGLAACCIGQAKLARSLAIAHAKERVQFGRPIARFGMVQELLAAMDADLYAMEAATWLTAGWMDQGRETMLEAACCKMFATERLWQIANDALQVTGGTGFMREVPFERILRDARINMIFEGTNQVLRMMLASQGLRSLARGAAAPDVSSPSEGSRRSPDSEFHPDYAAERATLERLTPLFAARCRAAHERHGEHVREAQFALHRLADMASALFVTSAVLARISDAEQHGEASERDRSAARLACRRLEKDFQRALLDEEQPDDALVERVAEGMTGG
jgi:acyl-CoA dehydrogenase family protein 9